MASLKQNYIYQMSYQVLIVIIPLITSPYLSRVVGSQGLGEYSYAYSIAYYFSLFILLGVNNHGTREIAKIKGNKQKISEKFWSIYLIQLIMGFIIILLYSLTQILGNTDSKLLMSIQLLYVCSAVLDINWFFFGLEKFKITVIRNFIIKVFVTLSIFLFVRDRDDVLVYACIMAFGYMASQMSLWLFAIKEIVFVPIKWKDIKDNIKPLLTLFIPVVAVSIFKYMDKIMLGAMCSKSELGLYDNSEKIMSIPTGLITAIGTVMLPRISNMMANSEDKKKVQDYMRISLKISMFMACALTFGLAAIALTFAPWFWGEEFIRCGDLIKLISVSILFLAWANVIRTQYLIPNGKDIIFVKATIYGAVINFTINYLLIEKYGAIGTAIGTVIAEFLVAFYQTIKCIHDLPIIHYIKECFPFILSGILMYIGIVFVSKMFSHLFGLLFFEIIIGAVIYFISIIIYYNIVKKYNISNMIKIIKK